MNRAQFAVLYREFLFRVVDMEILSPEGDITKLLGQFAALLITVSLGLVLPVWILATVNTTPEFGLIGAWIAEHFLIATTMLVVGLFAVMSWETTFPDRRDVLVLSPLPLRAKTLFAAKAAAVATALGITVAALNCITGLITPLAFAEAPAAPPPQYDAAIAPVAAGKMKTVLDRDLAHGGFAGGTACPTANAGATSDRERAAAGCAVAIGVVTHGERQIFTYGAAQPDSIYEIGSISKTFTALLLAMMAEEGRVRLDEPVRNLLPPGIVAKPAGAEITLLDLATHHSGLPRMPDNFPSEDVGDAYAHYHAANLYAFLAKHGLGKPANPPFRYSNLGFGLLGVALAQRAGTSYENLLRAEITGPLGLRDTTTTVTKEQRQRVIQAYDARPWPVPGWDLDAFAGAGAIRSTAPDLLTYLEAQLHPERVGALGKAIRQSRQLRADAGEDMRIGLSWVFDLKRGVYEHSGAISAYTSDAFFDPKNDYAGVVLFNEQLPVGLTGLLSEHFSQRLAGRPAVQLTPVVVAGRGGVGAVLRSFAAYWVTMLASGVFLFCCVLTVQGAAQLLPRQIFLRVSSWLQIAFFVLLLTVYFLQPPFSGADQLVEGQSVLWWLPSYWFFGMFQQLNGPIRPELATLAHRAWIALGAALIGAAGAYLVCYFRTLRKIAEQPDILPETRRLRWLPRFGGPFETAICQFSLRTLLRSRQHRVVLSFYVGVGFGLALFISKMPVLPEQRTTDLWYQLNAPLLVASTLLLVAAVVGTRVVFAMPLEPRANWIFRMMPLPDVTRSLAAWRRALYAIGLAPMWAALTLLVFWLWPWREAAGHAIFLGLVGVIVAELSLAGFRKIPFTCSYLPGKSHFHMAGVGLGLLIFLMERGAAWERSAMETTAGWAVMTGVLAIVAVLARYRTNSRAQNEEQELQFADEPEPAIQQLGLHRDGVLSIEK